MAETAVETQETSVEAAEASQAGPLVSETPEPVAALQEEAPPAELDEETQKRIDASLAEHFKEEPAAETPPPTEEEVKLTKAELEEIRRRERQSAQDRARAEAQAQQAREAEAMRIRQQRDADLAREIREEAERAVDLEGKLRPDFADSVFRKYRENIYGEAGERVGRALQESAEFALGQREVVQKAAEEDLEPLTRPYRYPHEYFNNLLEAHEKALRRQWEAEEKPKRERLAREMAKPLASAAAKKTILELRQGQSDKELPTGTAPQGDLSDAELAAHRGDLAWWAENRERYMRQLQARAKK